ncbi:MAG: hypothetical protein HY842_05530 [Bacteroidetes bacterium]|nr:hypothetical protein [Bacteroidota bacterium]
MKNFIKSFLSLVIVAMMGTLAFAGSTASPAPALATDAGPTVTGWFLQEGQSMTVEDFLKLTPKKIKESTGEKLSLKERLALRYVQSQIKREVKKGVSPSDEGFNLDDQARKFNIGGFLLGLFFGLIGFLIALLFKNKNVRRSALIGWGVWLVILLISLAAG